MRDNDAELAWLGRQVDDAVADDRRAEAVQPAVAFGLLIGSVPLLIFAVSLVFMFAA